MSIEEDKEEAKKAYYTFTGKASEISRQLAFAGFAIIWIFKDPSKLQIPSELFTPLILLGGTLLFDILQYFFQGCAWYLVYKFCQDYNKRWIPIVGWIFYLLKVILLIIGYVYIIIFAINQLH